MINYVRLALLIVVYGCVKHFTGHNCAAIAVVSSLLFIELGKEKPKQSDPEDDWYKDRRPGRA